MRLSRPMKMMLLTASAGPCTFWAYELETALALERRGLVTRNHFTVTLTEAGQEVVTRLWEERRQKAVMG